MQTRRDYALKRFPADAVQAALTRFLDLKGWEQRITNTRSVSRTTTESWSFDTDDEFIAEYRQGALSATFSTTLHGPPAVRMFDLRLMAGGTILTVEAPDRADITAIVDALEQYTPETLEEPKPAVTVFIGHGHSQQWRDLKDHLAEQHGYTVEAYEVGTRSGHAVRDVLEDMLAKSSFALLVMTGEDETSDGHLRTRQNVVHEAGLFQGRLGFTRAIALVEEGVEVFSNLDGIDQIRYPPGRIRETFGDVLAALRREFGARR